MADGIELASAYIQIIPSLKGATRQIESQLAGVDTKKAGAKIGEELSGSIADSIDMRAAGAKLQQGGSALKSFGDAAFNVGSKLTMGITVPLATAATGVGAFALKTASSAEVAEAGFETMLGSAEAAEKMMSDLADFAAHTPFELAGLQDASRKLLAYGFTAEDIIPMLTSVGDATAALGSGQEGIDAVTRALGQMRAKGKVSAEEMLQLTEQGIPAWEFLAQAIGTDTAGAMELVSKGAIDAETGIDALTSGMDRAFGGNMQKQAESMSGIMSNLADSIQQPLMRIKDSAAFDRLKKSLAEVAKSAGPFVESLLPHMERGLDAVAGVLDAASDAMDGFSNMSEDGQAKLIGLIGKAGLAGPALLAVGKSAKAVGTVMDVAGRGIEKAGGLLGRLSDAAGEAGGSASSLGGSLASLLGRVNPLYAAVGALAVGGIALFAANAIDAAERAQTVSDAMGVLESASTVAAASIDGASSATERFSDTASGLREAVDANWEALAALAPEFERIDAAASAQLGSLGGARQAIEDYAGAADLTAQQQGALTAAVEALNSACGTSYTVAKDAGGAYQVMSDGAVMAKDELYNLIDAQMQQARVTAQMDKLEKLYAEQADQAADYAEALSLVSEKERLVAEARERLESTGDPMAFASLKVAERNLRLAEDAAEEFKSQLDATGGSIAATEQSIGNMTSASSGAVDGFAALAQGSQGVNALFQQTGASMEDFALDLEASGYSLEEFKALTEAQLMEIAARWDGSTESIAAAMQDATGRVALSGDELIGKLQEAGVSAETLNAVGTASLDALAQACGGDVQSMVAELQNWNATDMGDKTAYASVVGNLPDRLAQADAWRRLPYNLGNKVGSAVISITQSVMGAVGGAFGHAAGGVRLHAEGGISTASVPVVATRPVPLDIVGEDGAEAIVPLTNRRYSQPFADIIAEGVAARTARGPRGGDLTADAIAEAMVRALSRTGFRLDMDADGIAFRLAPAMDRQLGYRMEMGL